MIIDTLVATFFVLALLYLPLLVLGTILEHLARAADRAMDALAARAKRLFNVTEN